VQARVLLKGQAAETTLDIHLSNPGPGMLEPVLLLPVPDGAVVKSFSFDGMKDGASARLLPRDEATRIYQSIVNQSRDPALLEYAGYNLVQSSVFPVGPHGGQRVRLVYEHLAPRAGNHIEYVLPRSVSVEHVVPWEVTVRVEGGHGISSVYSPSHEVAARAEAPGSSSVSVRESPWCRADAPPVGLDVSLRARWIVFRVSDNGPGIPRDRLRRLFTPFHKSAGEAARSAPGVGLGLALSRRLARRLGVDLVHIPPPGGGSAFELRLPRHAA
jgi:hypothetical protein